MNKIGIGLILGLIISIGAFFCTLKKPDDRGVLTKLPPWSDEELDFAHFNERNVFPILVNAKNELLVRGQPMLIENLKKNVKEFIANPNNNPEYAERPERAIISLKNDRGTNYEEYLKVYNELKAAYSELRDEKSQELFGQAFSSLDKSQKKEIYKMIPMVISEAEPTAFGEQE